MFSKIFLLLAVCVCSLMTFAIASQTGIVIKVADGDTLTVQETSGKKYSIRLIGIDAPESTKLRKWYIECFGKEAKKKLTALVLKRPISRTYDETQGRTDKYGRTLAYIWLGTWLINRQMITNGFAFEYTYNLPYLYQQDFKDAEKLAEQNKKGLRADTMCNADTKANHQEKIITATTTGTTSKLSCTTKKTCSQIKTCQDAVYYLETCGWTRLDADADGIPCETICK